MNTGIITNLPEIVEIKKRYKYRLILDESLSFGTLGKKCYGATDYFNVPSSEVEIIAGSFSCSLGTAGGFCAGDKNIINHQVLSSQAYCYSASLPAFLAAGAIVNLDKLDKNGNEISCSLSENIKTFRKEFTPYPSMMELFGSNNSPLVFLGFKDNQEVPISEQNIILKNIVDELKNDHKFLLALLKTVEKDEKIKHRPMIKIVISAGYTSEQVSAFAHQLRKTANKCVKN